MYSYEDRIRAVRLYIKLGKRTGPTIRQLGYLTKNELNSWCREYEQSRDVQVIYMRSRKKYSDARKLAAVQHYLNHDRRLASTMKALGYPCRELPRWIIYARSTTVLQPRCLSTGLAMQLLSARHHYRDKTLARGGELDAVFAATAAGEVCPARRLISTTERTAF